MWKVAQPITPQPWLYPMDLDDSNDMTRLLDEYDTFLFDCDGVLWGTDHYTKFGREVKICIEGLRRLGKRVLFVTNNSMHTRQAYQEKFKEMCDFDADADKVFSVNYAAAVYLKSIAKIQGRIYAIGSKGLSDELDSLGLNSFGYGTDPDPISDQKDDLMIQQMDPDVQAVLVGFDIHMGYNKIYKAASYLSDPNCIYLATNDIETRVEIGPNRIQPLTGVLTEAVNAASDRLPIVIGKPHHHLMSCMLNSYPDIDLRRTVMIGYSIKTDIGFAHNVGIDSILVLSGSTNYSDLAKYHDSREYEMPTYILSSIEQLGRVM
jgi:phosphoglycolate/pyridoxal phosphate phosphatase family enzyme